MRKGVKDYDNIFFNNVGVSNIQGNEILYANKGENLGWNTFLKKDPL